ncbi:MAG: leucine-rich repeat domain-containing protein [Eubacteriales bacterium]|nr:leucine-rich repeat domain-containing protein [Eubacteriales bacterium]
MELDIRDGILLGISGIEENITLPEGITSLGPFCFSSDPSLRSVRLPESLKSIGKDSFYGCSALENVHIPSGVCVIEENAFARCTALRDIVLPKGLVSIETNAFAWCAALERVAFNEGLRSIGDYAFYSCSSLREALLPLTLEEVGAGAFESCSLMRRVSLPEGLKSLGKSSFSFCRTVRRLEIPESITVLPDSCFAWCVSVREVLLPSGLTSVGDYCFFNCGCLERVDLPGALRYLGTECFSTCSLREVMVPQSVTATGEGPFYHNPGISLTVFPSPEFDPMHLACIDCPSDGEETKGATIYLDHSIGIFDPSTETVSVLPVFNDASSVYRYRVIVSRSFREGGDLCVLDDALADAISSSTFVRTALFRLRRRGELAEELREKYTDVIAQNSCLVMDEALKNDDLESVMLLSEVGVLSGMDTDPYIEEASRRRCTDICAYLMEEKNSRKLTGTSVLDELIL